LPNNRLRIGRSVGVVMALFGAMTSVRADDCPRSGGETVALAAVGPRLELDLDDGRVIRLAGLDPAQQTPGNPDLEDTSRAALAKLIGGRKVALHILSASPDRWKRLVAQAFLPEESGSDGDLATQAIAAGLGRYRAEPAARACRDALLAAEARARGGKLGLWADPYYALLAVDDRAAFTERSGTVVVAEGRLTAIIPGPFRTKLRFAPLSQSSYGGHTLSATILPRTMKTFEARRVMLSSSIGHVLRFRGLLDLRFGPQIEIEDPDQIETVAMPAGAAPTEQAN
jgi:endonuclease YncB( thermonuclease family)